MLGAFAPVSHFYPRSPCGERRLELFLYYQGNKFLSTLSLRRATMIHPRLCNARPDFYPRSPCGERRIKPIFGKINTNFYPRSPCGERRSADCNYRNARPISIHALLAESDAVVYDIVFMPREFLSTLSLRRATKHS